MNLNESFQKLKKNNVFSKWSKENKDSYLAHIFKMYDEANKDILQFGFYNKNDTITTFIMEGDNINEIPPQEVFKKGKEKLAKLYIDKVKIEFDDAMKIADDFHKEKYSQHLVLKKFAILQIINKVVLFNITFVTQTFNTLNIRIDAINSKIIQHHLVNLMDMAKFEKGDADKRDADYIG
jgi:hypothetical protein